MTKTNDQSRQFWLDNAQWQIEQGRIALSKGDRWAYESHMNEVACSQDRLAEFDVIQIKAAKDNAAWHGYDRGSIPDSAAIDFLQWYHNRNTNCASVEEAKRVGLLGLATNGIRQQASFWEEAIAFRQTNGKEA